MGMEKETKREGGREEGELSNLLLLLQGWNPKRNARDKPKRWLGADGEFALKELKAMIEDKLVAASNDGLETIWSKKVPKKIPIMIWRVKLGRIPTKEVLDKMGIDLNSVLCPRCSREIETINHALFRCEEVSKMWQLVDKWWKVDLSHIGSVEELLAFSNDVAENGRGPKRCSWSHRNCVVLKTDQRKERKIFEWVSARLQSNFFIGICG